MDLHEFHNNKKRNTYLTNYELMKFKNNNYYF